MAEKQGRLSEILEREYKSKGVVGGAFSATGKRLREIVDIRNVLFSGKGLGSIIGRKIFGKGYTASPERESISSKITSAEPIFSKESIGVLSEIKKDTRISAKNSIVLPSMARDMNLMRQNISKLVKLQGGTAASRADMFFARAKERESAYESQFGRKSPTPIVQTEKTESSNKGLFGLIFGLLASLGSLPMKLARTVGSAISSVFSSASGIFKTISGSLISLVDNIKNLIFKISDLTSNIVSSIFQMRILSAALAAASVLNNKIRPPVPVPTPDVDVDRNKTSRPGPGPIILDKDGKPISRTPQGPAPRPSSKWSKFLAWLERRSPPIFAKVSARLLAMPALATLPVLGWVMNLGLAAWLAYDLYYLWKEFNGMSEEATDSEINKAIRESNTSNDLTAPSNFNVSSLNKAQSEMATKIYNRFLAAGFNENQAIAAVANAYRESLFDPKAHNEKNEDSVGLFQMNRRGGLGVNQETKQPYSVEQLKNPDFNIDLAIDAAKKSKEFMRSTSVEDATAALVTGVLRPADQPGEIIKRTQIAYQMGGRSEGSQLTALQQQALELERQKNMGKQSSVVMVDNSVKNQTTGTNSGPVVPAWNMSVEQALSRQY